MRTQGTKTEIAAKEHKERAWRGAAFDCLKLNAFYWNIGFARLSVCWQAAPANVS